MNRVLRYYHIPQLHQLGWTGKGIGVAVLDTGVSRHVDLNEKIACFYDTIGGKSEYYDDNGHGTHVMGIIGGSGNASNGMYRGIAPECHLISVKVLDRKGNGKIPKVMEGIRWIIQNKEKYNIRIVNISIGSGSQLKVTADSDIIKSVEQLWDAGLVVLTAAGNNGPDSGSVTVPGISKKVITVGTSDDMKSTWIFGNQKTDYSGRGPTAECVLKPEIVAMGNDIVSCKSVNTNWEVGRKYTKKSGTSMSTPIVTGAVALLLQKEPSLTPTQVKIRFRDTARNIGMSRHKQGWGEIDMVKLLYPQTELSTDY